MLSRPRPASPPYGSGHAGSALLSVSSPASNVTSTTGGACTRGAGGFLSWSASRISVSISRSSGDGPSRADYWSALAEIMLVATKEVRVAAREVADFEREDVVANQWVDYLNWDNPVRRFVEAARRELGIEPLEALPADDFSSPESRGAG